ncbi:MAG: helicase associated domain-containing protein [Alphaproteobacteria bacterium]|nr:helicase associated domain-containing protein [Alphaproteobacteria bacterium]
MKEQRTNYKRDKLSPDKVKRVEALGFEWDPIAALWEKRFSELVRFKEEHGHCNVPRGWSENPELGSWAGTQRAFYSRGKLSPDKAERLGALEFEWDPNAAIWEKRFSELVRFNEEHDHCNVPNKWSENPELGRWVTTQRSNYKRDQLSPDKAERLEALGFEWDLFAALWEERFSELVRFKEEHGHCNVPARWVENPELSTWVTAQRSRRGKLSPDRVERLEALGFEWDPSSASWEKRFSELVRFKEEHGHCDVPARWGENPELGNWVHTQRRAAKNGQLIEERRRRLEEIGFRF